MASKKGYEVSRPLKLSRSTMAVSSAYLKNLNISTDRPYEVSINRK